MSSENAHQFPFRALRFGITFEPPTITLEYGALNKGSRLRKVCCGASGFPLLVCLPDCLAPFYVKAAEKRAMSPPLKPSLSSTPAPVQVHLKDLGPGANVERVAEKVRRGWPRPLAPPRGPPPPSRSRFLNAVVVPAGDFCLPQEAGPAHREHAAGAAPNPAPRRPPEGAAAPGHVIAPAPRARACGRAGGRGPFPGPQPRLRRGAAGGEGEGAAARRSWRLSQCGAAR